MNRISTKPTEFPWTSSFRAGTAAPIIALLVASAVCVGLVAARIVTTGSIRYAFLGWNLFLAWVPLVFAMLAAGLHSRSGRSWNFYGCAGAWLLFYPNAPYIFTDLIHLTTRFHVNFWVDLVLILSCALTGLVVGFVSLFQMQCVVAQSAGRIASWLFVGAVAGLSSFGVYLGRFLRFNSWDLLARPMELWRGIGGWVSDPMAHSTTYAFPVLFAVFLFTAYLMLYALTHLQPAATHVEPSSRVSTPKAAG
jgi:uncharacterized membrane protein